MPQCCFWSIRVIVRAFTTGRVQVKADIEWKAGPAGSVENEIRRDSVPACGVFPLQIFPHQRFHDQIGLSLPGCQAR